MVSCMSTTCPSCPIFLSVSSTPQHIAPHPSFNISEKGTTGSEKDRQISAQWGDQEGFTVQTKTPRNAGTFAPQVCN